MTPRRLLPVVLLPLALAACSSGAGSSTPTASSTGASSPSTTASASAPAGASASASASRTSAGDEPAEPGQPFVAASSTAQAPANPSGRGLSVTAVRTGTHSTYDRVVLELGGTGTVGWQVRYDSDPRRQGSGDPVRLDGTATLSVLLDGVAYPTDSGVPEYSGPRALAPGLPSVRAVQLGGVFEGRFDAFVGVSGQKPFRVFRLDSPQRVVVDVQH